MDALDRLEPAHWREAARAYLVEQTAALNTDFDAGVAVERLLERRCRAVDEIVCSAWRVIAGEPGLTLLATGGYGRGELYPYSDVDLLVLGAPAIFEAKQAELQAFFAALWDVGLAPGHASRSVDQCVEEATADLTVISALLDARILVGAPAALERLRDKLSDPGLWPPAAFFNAKRDELRARHARYNDTAYNLEPNLKEGPGGLRDLHTLGWMAQRLFRVRRLDDLQSIGMLGADEAETLAREHAALARLRVGLHLVAGRREERLLFEHQTSLAKRLQLRDEHKENLAVEQLMQGYFRSAALVLRLSERLLQRFEESLASAVEVKPLDADFALENDYLRLRADKSFPGDGFAEKPSAIFDLFRIWQATPGVRGLHSTTARALGESLPLIDERFRADPLTRQKFMALLRDDAAAETLARMAHLGVLGRYLPAFGRVSGRMQYDLFHVYTVDQHTLTVIRNIASFRSEESRQRFSLAYEVWPRLRKPELLLLAGLFHDIAKGRGGDHSQLGAEDAREFCLAHGLSAADTDLVVWLVQQHLTMSVTAQRQDITDPEVIRRFAELVAERERLDYLYLLTVADIAGTSPKLWNAWKDRLLADLYGATRFALRRGLAHPLHVDERVTEAREEARAVLLAHGMQEAAIQRVWAEFPENCFLRFRPEQIAWQTLGIAQAEPGRSHVLVRPHQRPGALEVFVYSPDRDGLFAAACATLDRLGLNVVEARIVTSTRGMSLDTFQVLDAGSEFISPQRRAATVAEALRETLARDPLIVPTVRRATPRQLKHFRVPVRVDFEVGNGRTELALVCADRPGLLALVSSVFREHRLRVHEARIATFGERVEDFFQLSDENDRPLDEAAMQALRAALIDSLEPERKQEV
ncbi:MAG TPA: [protein-PII] uridylyltransferase [Vicinamibacterales bacterium]|nr:[protein-PII] uridylyltransferase [Vicinamibacterales bacterium]